MTTTHTIQHDDMLDVRDLIERFEELESSDITDTDELAELATLIAVLDELKGMGGDEQWRGDWYPIQLIAESYFTEYARELCEDIGDIPRDLPHYIEIDWNATADNIRVDYTSICIDGVTYLYR